MALVGAAGPAGATPATFTGTNSSADGNAAHCLNGNGLDPVNCNLYDAKEHVWLNAGPANAQLPEGDYFFAVLVPGGQHDPNDGDLDNLSDGANGDATTRSFHVDGSGVITYTGTHDFDATNNKIRLMPYDNTTNPGGVYILAICNAPHPAVPSQCKYDAFKVPADPTEEPAQVNAVFSGHKWQDDDSADGVLGALETPLEGWAINISKDGVLQAGMPIYTDAQGEWNWAEPTHDAGAGDASTYMICEVMQTGWRQTGPLDASTVGVSGGAVPSVTGLLSDATRCYSVDAPDDVSATASDLDFFNVRLGSLAGAKYYDSNGNGALTAGEAQIAGWRIQVSTSATFATVLATIYTDVNGNFTLGNLSPGTYYVREVQAGNGWSQTGNLVSVGLPTGAVSINNKVYTVVIGTGTDVTQLYFGNVCRVTPGGHTLGFWSNKNGQALITATDVAGLVALNLRNANGTAFDPTGSLAQSKSQINTWLLNGNATNMAYMLSVQMAATYLSTQHGFTNASVVVDGTNTVTQEIAYANGLLANPIAGGTFNGLNGSVTVAAGALRTEQGRVKNILDLVNNNGSFQQSDGTPCGAPAFPVIAS
jgi:hypothetical protein